MHNSDKLCWNFSLPDWPRTAFEIQVLEVVTALVSKWEFTSAARAWGDGQHPLWWQHVHDSSSLNFFVSLYHSGNCTKYISVWIDYQNSILRNKLFRTFFFPNCMRHYWVPQGWRIWISIAPIVPSTKSKWYFHWIFGNQTKVCDTSIWSFSGLV